MQQQFEHQNQKTNHCNTTPFYSNTWFGLGLIICLLISGYCWDKYFAPTTVVTTTKVISVPKTSDQSSSGVKFAKIQDVQVGERAIGMNPELTDSERATFLSDPEPTTWRKLTLEMIKSDGKRLDITLLRPLSWIVESQADIGTTIFLDLPELGAQGFAKVLNIEPCPPIKSGKGNVITGTFHHEAANTIDLYVEGLSKPIGCTDNHPFWSVTRNEFIEAGKLQLGEELHLYSGQTAKVIQILPRPGPEQVHNLEVMNEHVYRVTQEGVLVHNACLKPDWLSIDWGRNRLVKELHDHGFTLQSQTNSGGGLMYVNGNGDRIRIMPRPTTTPSRSSPPEKYEGEYYFRYCEKNGEWGPHVPIPDK